jgi:hypothetical protein
VADGIGRLFCLPFQKLMCLRQPRGV